MGAKWNWETKSVGIARQTDYTTPNTTAGSFMWFDAEMDLPGFAWTAEDFSSASGQYGAKSPPAVGPKHGGDGKLRMPLSALKAGYDPTSENPGSSGVISPVMVMVGNALGSEGSSAVASDANFVDGTHLSTSSYIAGDIATGSTTTVPKVDTGASYTAGQMFIAQTAAQDDSGQIGWIKSIDTTPTPDELTLAEASANAAALNDHNYGTAVAFLADVQRVPMTMWVVGSNSAFKLILEGVVFKAVEIVLDAGETSMVELEFEFDGYDWASTGGGLQVGSAFIKPPPIIGNNNGRLIYGDQGSAAVVCGLQDVRLRVEWPLKYIPCHSSPNGYSDVIHGEPEVMLECKIPLDSTDVITDGLRPYEGDFNSGTTKSVQITTGDTVGAIASILLPALHLAEAPTYELIDGVTHAALKLRPSTYSGDGGSSAPSDTLVRVGVG